MVFRRAFGGVAVDVKSDPPPVDLESFETDDPSVANLYQLFLWHVGGEPARIRKLVIKAVSIGTLIAGSISGGWSAWGQIRAAQINAKSQHDLVESQQKADKERPSTNSTYLNGYKDGARDVGIQVRDEILKQLPIGVKLAPARK
jgi:hypothetical protein